MTKKKKDFVYYWEKPLNIKEETVDLEFDLSTNYGEMMPINIIETENKIVVKAEMPDFKKNEINLNLSESSLEINATKIERKIGKTMEENTSHQMKRSFSLPKKIDPDTAKATFKKGMLKIEMEKTDNAGRKKNINIK